MIILTPPMTKGKDGRLYAHIFCDYETDHRELHEFAKQLGLPERMYDPSFKLGIHLYQSGKTYEGTVILSGAYWITPHEHDQAKCKAVATVWKGRSACYELCERGLYSNPDGLIPTRAKPQGHTGLPKCSNLYPSDEIVAYAAWLKWKDDPARLRLLESIEGWLRENTGSGEDTRP